MDPHRKMLQLAGTESTELYGILNIYLTLKEAKIQRSQETYVWLKRKKQTNKQKSLLLESVFQLRYLTSTPVFFPIDPANRATIV